MYYRIALIMVAAVLAAPAHADQRVALVIGVADYAVAEPLLNPVRDAEAVAARFRSLGYETRLLANASRAEMEAAIAGLQRAERRLDQAVFYFAGHGVQVDGANYLLPADWTEDRAIDETALSLRDIARSMADAAQQTVFMIDACRDNPWDETEIAWGYEDFAAGRRSAAPRTAVMKAGMARLRSDTLPPNSIFSFSALPGHFAFDGDGPISDYAAAFVTHAARPEAAFSTVFSLIADEVSKKSGGEQFPQVVSQLTQPAMLGRAAPQLPAPAASLSAADPYAYARRPLGAAFSEELAEAWPRSVDQFECPLAGRYFAALPEAEWTSLERLSGALSPALERLTVYGDEDWDAFPGSRLSLEGASSSIHTHDFHVLGAATVAGAQLRLVYSWTYEYGAPGDRFGNRYLSLFEFIRPEGEDVWSLSTLGVGVDFQTRNYAEPGFVWLSPNTFAIRMQGARIDGARAREDRFILPLDGCFVTVDAPDEAAARRRLGALEVETRGLSAFARNAPPAAPIPAAQAAAPQGEGAFVAVLGSFRSAANAEAALDELRAREALAAYADRMALWSVSVDGAAWRRLIIGGFASREEAAAVCAVDTGAAGCFAARR